MKCCIGVSSETVLQVVKFYSVVKKNLKKLTFRTVFLHRHSLQQKTTIQTSVFLILFHCVVKFNYLYNCFTRVTLTKSCSDKEMVIAKTFLVDFVTRSNDVAMLSCVSIHPCCSEKAKNDDLLFPNVLPSMLTLLKAEKNSQLLSRAQYCVVVSLGACYRSTLKCHKV